MTQKEIAELKFKCLEMAKEINPQMPTLELIKEAKILFDFTTEL